MPFALKLANDGDDAAIFETLRFQVTFKTYLYDDAGSKPPDDFRCEIVIRDEEGRDLPPGNWIGIAGGDTADVRGFVRWVVPPEAPPMLAIVRAEFLPIRRGDELMRTEPLIMYLQSKPGALDAVRKSATTTAKQAVELADGLRKIDGKRTADFEDLIRSIEAIANREL
jgi:hypothetical protein